MTKLRGLCALLAMTAAALLCGPFGCLPQLPQAPTTELPQMPQAEFPQAPEVKVPEFKPPEVTPPDGPELPAQPPESRGNCCIRTGRLLRDICQGAMSCCTDKFEDTGDCEDEKGYWFFTPEGCAGAC